MEYSRYEKRISFVKTEKNKEDLEDLVVKTHGYYKKASYQKQMTELIELIPGNKIRHQQLRLYMIRAGKRLYRLKNPKKTRR